jgi:hypothetical protein
MGSAGESNRSWNSRLRAGSGVRGGAGDQGDDAVGHNRGYADRGVAMIEHAVMIAGDSPTGMRLEARAYVIFCVMVRFLPRCIRPLLTHSFFDF